MKEHIISVLFSASIALSCAAQLQVTSNGQIQVGNIEDQSSASKVVVITPGSGPAVNPDTTAAIYIAGPKSMQSGGKIAFGKRGDVTIGESIYSALSSQSKGKLELVGNGGFSFYTGNGLLATYDSDGISGSVNSFIFKVPVSATQYLTSSDARLKKDIQELTEMGNHIKDLIPVSYVLQSDVASAKKNTDNKTAINSDNIQLHHQYGFLAQDVQKIYPELVYEDAEGMLSIDYIGFIPLLVDAVKSLEKKTEEQQEIIESLKKELNRDSDKAAVAASLSQNKPNPFRTSTVIGCVLPEETGVAFICIYDLNGNQKARYDIRDRGDVSVIVEGNTLNAGMYIYTLIVDGVEVDSKRMILTD